MFLLGLILGAFCTQSSMWFLGQHLIGRGWDVTLAVLVSGLAGMAVSAVVLTGVVYTLGN